MVLRRIKTKEEMRKKNKQNQIIIGVVMIFLLVLATAGYSLMSSEEDSQKKTEGGLKFYRDLSQGLWTTQVNGRTIAMQLLPSEVENIPVEGIYTLQSYQGQPLYFVGASSAVVDVINNLVPYASRYQEACMIDSDCDGDLPIKDCSSNIIIFEEGVESRVYQEDNCVFLVGDGIGSTDAFLYKLFGVI